jgi:drug/metabolite transporter (DMT)-like permease
VDADVSQCAGLGRVAVSNIAGSAESRGMLLGLIGVIAFSLTLPATRAAVASLDPLFVSSGRAVVAALLAAIFLWLGKHRKPTKAEFKSLLIVASGVVFGFPFFTAWAMRYTSASHGGVVLGILPLATAAAGAIFSRERPSKAFWFAAVTGSALVVSFSLMRSHGALQLTDLALVAAVIFAAVGYAVGAQLAKTLGGLQVISWALVVALPFTFVPAILTAPASFVLPGSVWIGFIYASVVSQYLGFLPWYRGLALGGTARVGQTQLLQPFFTLFAAALLLHETVDAITIGFALLVFVVVAFGRKLSVAQSAN